MSENIVLDVHEMNARLAAAEDQRNRALTREIVLYAETVRLKRTIMALTSTLAERDAEIEKLSKSLDGSKTDEGKP